MSDESINLNQFVHDEAGIGWRIRGENSASKRPLFHIVERPPHLTNTEWNLYAANLCQGLHREVQGLKDRYDAANSANMALYSGLWRHGLPLTNRAGQSLQQFIDTLTDHINQKMKPPAKKPRINTEELVKDLRCLMEARDMTWRGVSGATGVNTTTLSKLQRGQTPDVTNMLCLCNWLGNRVEEYLIAGTK